MIFLRPFFSSFLFLPPLLRSPSLLPSFSLLPPFPSFEIDKIFWRNTTNENYRFSRFELFLDGVTARQEEWPGIFVFVEEPGRKFVSFRFEEHVAVNCRGKCWITGKREQTQRTITRHYLKQFKSRFRDVLGDARYATITIFFSYLSCS